MFYIEDKWVKLFTGGQIIAPVSQIPKLIEELTELQKGESKNGLEEPRPNQPIQQSYQASIELAANDGVKTWPDDELDVDDTPTELAPEDRYTLEGIDRLFKASPNFIPSKERWENESKYFWSGIPGRELFSNYQKHAEFYCEGCMENGTDPTYEGFRQFLINLRSSPVA